MRHWAWTAGSAACLLARLAAAQTSADPCTLANDVPATLPAVCPADHSPALAAMIADPAVFVGASSTLSNVLDASLLDPAPQAAGAPLLAMAAGDDESIYPQLNGPQETPAVNSGSVNFNLEADYLTQYVYRGVDHSRVGGRGAGANLAIQGQMTFDLGKFPHPFVGVFTDVFDSDPVSRFQEIRPFIGALLPLRPFTFEGGLNSYIYPERENFDTAEVYGKISFDDSLLLNTERPVLTPYVYAAYDYDRNSGWYMEAGISHDFIFEDWGLTFTPHADIAYILGYQQQFIFVNRRHDSGWQHYDVGLSAAYSLNTLFNFPKRYGEFDLKGYLVYTGAIQKNITADNVLWGGAGIEFKY